VVSIEDKVPPGGANALRRGVSAPSATRRDSRAGTELTERLDRLMLDSILPELAASGIAIVPYGDLDFEAKERLGESTLMRTSTRFSRRWPSIPVTLFR